jgi:hypothetical protein
MKIGDQVLCEYRLPYANQWWIHPCWVGVIENVGRDKAAWNGSNTEEQYCVTCKAVKVRYLASASMDGHIQHDSLGGLRRLHFGDVAKSPCFDSSQTGKRDLYEFACKAGFGDRYCDVVRIPPRSQHVTLARHLLEELSQ